MSKQIRATDYWPEYLKLELGHGTTHAHPIGPVLDRFLEDCNTLAHQIGASLDPAHFPIPRRREVLLHLGFETATLVDAEASALFEDVHRILQERSSLAGVERLAKHFFGTAKVSRGLGLQVISGRIERLVDSTDRDRILLVRLAGEAAPDRVQEFQRNCRRLVPDSFAVRVAGPVKIVAKTPTGFRLEALRLHERRV